MCCHGGDRRRAHDRLINYLSIIGVYRVIDAHGDMRQWSGPLTIPVVIWRRSCSVLRTRCNLTRHRVSYRSPTPIMDTPTASRLHLRLSREALLNCSQQWGKRSAPPWSQEAQARWGAPASWCRNTALLRSIWWREPMRHEARTNSLPGWAIVQLKLRWQKAHAYTGKV